LILTLNQEVLSCGSNYNGQLGLDDTNYITMPVKHPSLSNIIDVSKGGVRTFVKTSNNEIYAFGYNEYLQLGIKTEDEDEKKDEEPEDDDVKDEDEEEEKEEDNEEERLAKEAEEKRLEEERLAKEEEKRLAREAEEKRLEKE